MTTSLTFGHAVAGHHRRLRWTATLVATLIAVSAPTVACEKPAGSWIASAQGEPRSEATFTGEFVNGTPVYRLPAITVVSRRSAEVAKKRRDDAPQRAGQSRPGAPVAARPAGKVASADHEAIAPPPCMG